MIDMWPMNNMLLLKNPQILPNLFETWSRVLWVGHFDQASKKLAKNCGFFYNSIFMDHMSILGPHTVWWVLKVNVPVIIFEIFLDLFSDFFAHIKKKPFLPFCRLVLIVASLIIFTAVIGSFFLRKVPVKEIYFSTSTSHST